MRRSRAAAVGVAAALLCAACPAYGFSARAALGPTAVRVLRRPPLVTAVAVAAAAVAMPDGPTPQHPLPAPWPYVTVGSKVVNLYSVVFLAVNIIGLCVAYPLLAVAYTFSFLFDRKRRRAMDAVVALWARLCLTLFFFSRVRVEGVENLPPRGQAALYTPNHCSFLDIFSLSGFLPRPLKYSCFSHFFSSNK